jgi:predicted PurR-regulated permease PerM
VGGIDGVSIPSARGGLRRGLVARCSLFLVTGAVWEGLILIAYGVLVIGLVDNLARPMLVGADTKMPDYVVLISTLGDLKSSA